MDELADVGRSLSPFALVPSLVLAAILLWVLLRGTSSVAAAYVLIAIEFRIALTAAHDLTFLHSPLGISYNAIATIAISGIGLCLVRRRGIIGAALPPFLIYLAVLVASGIVTSHVSTMANTFSKFAYLIVLTLAVEDALDDLGIEKFLRLLVPMFALPFLLQAFSVVLNEAKASESDGSASYIGGFYHEAAFSVTLAAAILAVCLMRRIGLITKIALLALGVAGILLANYRTVIVAMLPLVGVAMLLDTPRHFVPRQRAIVVGLMAVFIAAAGAFGAVAGEQRFGDLGTAFEQGASLIKRPENFTLEERAVMSGRPAIWSGYIYGWVDASPEHKLIGLGPGSWPEYFKLYAHNTLVSALFELGVLGVFATTLLWVWMLVLSFFVTVGPRLELIAAHLCFFVLNMATMPMWLIEGMIFYGLLCGCTLHFYHDSRKKALRGQRTPASSPMSSALAA